MSKPIYDHIKIEEKWMKEWEELGLFQHSEKRTEGTDNQEKMYLLFAFAYPSGAGLHVGHVESKTALDIMARYYRMNGKHVFFPVGWDAFGLPAENYAIKTGIPPAVTTKKAIDTFRGQIKRLGISYDWANEIATNHPEYYKWTQWIFLELYKKGLAYQATAPVNWCPQDQTVLANEQVVNGKCERCGSEVIQKEMKQWFFKITEYQDELISGLDIVDWPNATKQQQLNWIGKSKGLNIDFTLEGSDEKLTVWTKFWETVFGTTFVVIAPEKFEVMNLIEQVSEKHREHVKQYLALSKKKTEEERKIGKDKTGVDTGLKVVNPVNGHSVPLFIADYVLMGVGTAIVMGVPAHDDRDFQFAKKFGLKIQQVVSYQDKKLNEKVQKAELPFEGEGKLVHSGKFDGMDAWGDGKTKMAEWMIGEGFANWQTTYKLRDWLISRQRYWGAPIPVVYDPEGKAHPVKEEHLPWTLPTDVEFKPTGESPLTHSKEFIERTERLYGKGWRPEYDTMDTFVDSSWYFLRYVDSRNKEQFASRQRLMQWLPVDLYMIGPEHIVLHLLYSRFLTKFLRDAGYLTAAKPQSDKATQQSKDEASAALQPWSLEVWSVDEPFMKMRHQGMILGPDGKKMSKSKGNVINPDEIIEKFGADTLRVYEMFMGPIEADKPWNTNSVVGIYRFLNRIFKLVTDSVDTANAANLLQRGNAAPLQRKLHQTIKKVTQDIPEMKFNTAIAAMMELVNAWEESTKSQTGAVLSVDDIKAFIKILCPFAPFMAEELWVRVCSTLTSVVGSVHLTSWPSYQEDMLVEEVVSIVVQINGKMRATVEVDAGLSQDKDAVIQRAKQNEKITQWLQGKTVRKEIFVPGKIVNFVVHE